MYARSSIFAVPLLCLACAGDAFQDPPPPASGAAGFSGEATGGGSGQGGKEGGAGGPGGAGAAGLGGQAGNGGSGDPAGSGGESGQAGTSAGAGEPGGSAQQGGAAGETQGGAAGEMQGGAAGAGALCEEGQFVCKEGGLFACSGGALQKKQACAAELCDASKGTCLTCIPKSVLGCFNESIVLRCDETGQDKSLETCLGEKPFCAGGKCVECLLDTDCKEEIDCYGAICANGACVQEPSPAGKLAKNQTPNDCQRKVCDGKGKSVNEPDLEDLPLASSDCTVGVCKPGGQPAQAPAEVGKPCEQGGVCNGKGVCGECIPGEVSCDGTASKKVCGEAGIWEKGVACPASMPACSAGACVGVVQLAAGEAHSCALLSDGTVRCWGNNLFSQLGVSDLAGSNKPVPIPGLEEVDQITAGANHSCALAKGKVYCWGLNVFGAVGDGSSMNGAVLSPSLVDTEAKFSQIAAGKNHTCGVSEGGDVYCWGDNWNGKSGKNNAEKLGSPSLVQGLSGVKKVALGAEHSCALDASGSIWCWGNNSEGQLGDGKAVLFRHTPKKVIGLAVSVDNLLSGVDHLFATKKSSSSSKILDIWSWGGNEFRQNFSEDLKPITKPQPQDLSDIGKHVTQIVPGHQTSVMIAVGLAMPLGRNDAGQLGIGKKDPSWGSGVIEGIPGVVEVVPGKEHMCARQAAGKVWCWGQGSKGQLGNGLNTEQLTPVEVVW